MLKKLKIFWLSIDFYWHSTGFYWPSTDIYWLPSDFYWLSSDLFWLSTDFCWLLLGVFLFCIFQNCFVENHSFCWHFEKLGKCRVLRSYITALSVPLLAIQKGSQLMGSHWKRIYTYYGRLSFCPLRLHFYDKLLLFCHHPTACVYKRLILASLNLFFARGSEWQLSGAYLFWISNSKKLWILPIFVFYYTSLGPLSKE